MRILIVEDEAVVARWIEQSCRRCLGARLETLRVAGTFAAARAALEEAPIDALLLDLNLGGEDGMALLETSVAGSFHTIIVSANTEHALRAFEHGVIDFVPKPFTDARLAQALARLTETGGHSPHAARYLAVRKHGRVQLVAVERVRYVQGADDWAELVLDDGRRELHDKTLEKLGAILPSDFERIHKSFLVRLSAVRALHVHEGSRYEAELSDGTRLPVGRTRYKELREKLG
ncbi:MAG TPA: LytTR family DNA-binding domain-containing protein [Candidatus Didemnitutus sp.]|nr:LytTR family DNA-binding domain-containing protein [Candidatus Didemnitutus sp.]